MKFKHLWGWVGGECIHTGLADQLPYLNVLPVEADQKINHEHFDEDYAIPDSYHQQNVQMTFFAFAAGHLMVIHCILNHSKIKQNTIFVWQYHAFYLFLS